jgi:biopolymer transport protein ExbD
MFLSHSGVVVELPASQFQMERYQDSIVVTLGPGEGQPRLHLGRQAVSLEELAGELERLKDDEANARVIVMLKTDVGVSVGVERHVSEIILKSGFKLALVGSPVTPETDRTSGSGGAR